MDGIVKSNRRHRYISFCVASLEQNSSITKKNFIEAIQRHTNDLFSKTLKELGLWVVQFEGNTGVIKCNFRDKEHIIYLLQSLKKIGSSSVVITTCATSGTIHGIAKKFFKKKNDRNF